MSDWPSIKFSCSSCGRHLAANAADAGFAIDCPECGTNLIIPPVNQATTKATSAANPSDNQPSKKQYSETNLESDAVDTGNSIARPQCIAETAISIQKSVSKPTVTPAAEQSANKPMVAIALNRKQFVLVCVVLITLLCAASLGVLNLIRASHNKAELPKSKSESSGVSEYAQKLAPPRLIVGRDRVYRRRIECVCGSC
jgi:DNA-directed RNA polymerase subunit RPC12/RpoP